MSRVPYTSMVSILMYAMVYTRLEIAPVGVLSRYMSELGNKLWTTVKRIFRYLCGTNSYGLWYQWSKSFHLRLSKLVPLHSIYFCLFTLSPSICNLPYLSNLRSQYFNIYLMHGGMGWSLYPSIQTIPPFSHAIPRFSLLHCCTQTEYKQVQSSCVALVFNHEHVTRVEGSRL